MTMNELHAISPVDGRYWKTASALSDYFSEFALIRYRVLVETEYLAALKALPLASLKKMPARVITTLRKEAEKFSDHEALRIKEIEKTTNHDVKAVEYYLRERFSALDCDEYREFIHFGLTSQDINNTAVPMMIRDALMKVVMPGLVGLMNLMEDRSADWRRIPMLARTHGQPASPTTMGKEWQVFAERLSTQFAMALAIPMTCKFGGATGNFNAHKAAFPEVDWIRFADEFCSEHLGLMRQQTTTQIEHYDLMAALFDTLKRICTILLDFSRDIWTYVSMDYFKQKIKKGEVGSSAMPHKVNPIDFENAEGNLGICIALLEHLSAKLPVSRLQRDLTDSTVSRNIGLPFAHLMIAVASLNKGINKLVLNEAKIHDDLDANWVIVAEGLQTILRREGISDAYGLLKELTRTGEKISKTTLHAFIDTLAVSKKVRDELKELSPFSYTGYAGEPGKSY